MIHKKFGDIFLSGNDTDGLEEYLSEVYRRDISGLMPCNESDKTGWLTIDGVTKYFVGKSPFYAKMGMVIPNIDKASISQIFLDGFKFRDIGHKNHVIEILWLAAHIPYTLFWLRQYNIDFRSVLFLRGKTGTYKTSVVSLLSNVFARNRKEHACIRLTSTTAYIQEYIVHLKDNFVCLDDFSNTAGANNKLALQNAETVIRAVGDGIFSGKMSVKDYSQARADAVRCLVTFTGEDELGLGQSSLLRLLILPVYDGTFDKKILAKYQKDPKRFVDYFACFIAFLAEHGDNIVKKCSENFEAYREYYASVVEVPRLVDAATTLRMMIDVVSVFANYCSIDENFITEYGQRASTAVVSIIKGNYANEKTAAPEIRYLYALAQSLGTSFGTNIAPDEETYVENESAHIGFRDDKKNLLWLRFEDTMNLVSRYYQKQGQQWLTSSKTIKEILLKNEISVGKVTDKGTEYLCRAKKGTRKRMLVLKVDVVEKILEKILEENKGDLI